MSIKTKITFLLIYVGCSLSCLYVTCNKGKSSQLCESLTATFQAQQFIVGLILNSVRNHLVSTYVCVKEESNKTRVAHQEFGGGLGCNSVV